MSATETTALNKVYVKLISRTCIGRTFKETNRHRRLFQLPKLWPAEQRVEKNQVVASRWYDASVFWRARSCHLVSLRSGHGTDL